MENSSLNGRVGIFLAINEDAQLKYVSEALGERRISDWSDGA